MRQPNHPGLFGLYVTKRFEYIIDRPLPLVEEERRAAELESLWLQLDYEDQDFADTLPRV
jgi:hypothetical protein